MARLNHSPRPIPQTLEPLIDIALDMRWSWNHAADRLWEAVEPELWTATGNPWVVLESVSNSRLNQLAADEAFLAALRRQVASRHEYLNASTWFSRSHGREKLGGVAYFSMEFGLSDALPIYSGGLGILAGDHMKAASDLGVPVVGVGLLYQQGYFRQAISAVGEQIEFFPYNAPAMLPISLQRDPHGELLRINVELPGRDLNLRVWRVVVGRATLYLLDSNDPLNTPNDRSITSELYGGEPEMRLQQEIVLGVGGWRLLEAVGEAVDVCHLNEGHAAFLVLERARNFAARSGRSFAAALWATRAGNLFTTHTPVAAGFDRFEPYLFTQYFQAYAARLGITIDELMALGRLNPDDSGEPFNMANLAMRGCGRVNGVSRLHAEVTRRIFMPLFPRWPEAEVPIGHVTNGVHVPTWDSAAADTVWTEACGKERWLGTLEGLEANVCCLTDEALWSFRSRGRTELVDSVRKHAVRQRATWGQSGQDPVRLAHLFDPNILTLGMARRFTAYKRPNLLLHNADRLARILTNPERPAQLVVAGKAHARDVEGKRMVRQWIDFMRRPDIAGRVLFIQDYDMAVASELVRGVDIWINTPRRPWEASGTSGMKVLVNGGLNLSELEGWWAEAFTPEVGWAIGDGKEHNSDPSHDAAEADELYECLEREVIPAFYACDERGIAVGWVAKMRESMSKLTPRFSANRMVREYTEHCYLGGARSYRRRADEDGKLGAELEAWSRMLSLHWSGLRFGNLYVHQESDETAFRVQLYLSDLDRDAVRVELYADAIDGRRSERITMSPLEPIPGAHNGFTYGARVRRTRSADDYTPRVVAHHPDAHLPLEASNILWYR